MVAVSDATGAGVATSKYSVDGASASLASEFGFTGQLWLPSVQLYYYKARMYSPQLGRFMQRDPLGYAAGLNLYAYAGGDPVNARDPSGLATKQVELLVSSSRWTEDLWIMKFVGFISNDDNNNNNGGSADSKGQGGGGPQTQKPGTGEQGQGQSSCPQPPVAPPGVSVNSNIGIAKNFSWMNPVAATGLYALVRNFGPWDYKRRGRQYEDFGNFNFGAVTFAMGMPYYIAQNGAGIYQQLRGAAGAGEGVPFLQFPYGDAISDARQIQLGRQYVQQGCAGGQL